MLAPVDITFELLWRDPTGTDHPIAAVTHHFDPRPSGFMAVPFETELSGAAAPARRNDLLVLRLSAPPSDAMPVLRYIPNGDGALTGGRLPSLLLPPG